LADCAFAAPAVHSSTDLLQCKFSSY
jgi:hypothetical protein